MSSYHSSSLTEISKSKLVDFLNSSNIDNSKCSSKCETLTSSSSSSSSSSSCKNKSRKHKSKKNKSKSKSSIYTTTLQSSDSCSSSSNSKPCKTSSSSCPTSSSSKCSSSSSKSCSSSSSCINSCNPYALRCNTYKSVGGTVLIPGPQGPSSGSLANFSGINNTGGDPNNINFAPGNIISSNITASGSPLNTFTFYLAGRYLFQYNINVSTVDLGDPNQIYFLLNGSTQFGNQNISGSETYGCSIIRDMNAGDYINLICNFQWTFASLTIIKL